VADRIDRWAQKMLQRPTDLLRDPRIINRVEHVSEHPDR
jgi:hypothetical protein